MKRPRVGRIITTLMQTTPFKRKTLFLLADAILIIFAVYVSFGLRFDGKIPEKFLTGLWVRILLILIVTITMLAIHGLYNISWRFFGLKDMVKLLQAVTLAFLLLVVMVYGFDFLVGMREIPRTILLLSFNFTLVLLGMLRISKRVVREYRLRRLGMSRGRKKVLIIGAGSAGEQIVREMTTNQKSVHFPVGFVDDDRAKQGTEIHGIKVLGTRDDIPKILRGNGIDEVLIAIPSVRSKDILAIVELVRSTGEVNSIKVLPGIHDIVEGKISLGDIKDIEVEDLLGRAPVQVDYEKIRAFLSDKRILVSGAGGSIGSELARTIAQFGPASLILLDNDETELFYVVNRLKNTVEELVPVVATVRDQIKIDKVFEKFHPEIVLHAAALKHVPILEHYPDEAVKTNIRGTRILGEAAMRFGVERFVNISTDKAVNPTSVMGASKRIGEEILRVLNTMGGTRFISVRFGNVLGSRGSVIPLFKEQIRKGGPVTVTHAKVKRYFMAVSEAVLLVLEAAAAGKGGEAFILDMGEQVNIDELAREMIRLSGYKPDVDIAIVYTGLRSGEKLYEELLGAEEGTVPTEFEKIFLAKNAKPLDASRIWRNVDRLIDACESGSCGKEDLLPFFKEIVPTYVPNVETASINHW